ncbi:unnamed protein product, partial [marine sediment metagenome]
QTSYVGVKARNSGLPEIVSIFVTPTTVDFGDLYEGEPSAPETVTVTNTGTVDVTVTAGISNTFFHSLTLNDGHYASGTGWALGTISESVSLPVYLVLTVPVGAPTGLQEGTLVFTAIGQ